MPDSKKILAISGSTRLNSSNLNLINAIKELFHSEMEITIFEGLANIPHFNPDLDNESSPAAVLSFRNAIKKADGVLICTPEYAMGVPGTLKNAIDWTVSSCEFSHKPVALITASSMGQKGHLSLLDTLKIIECDIPEGSELIISFVKTKVSTDNKITDANTLEQINNLIYSFLRCIDLNKTSI